MFRAFHFKSRVVMAWKYVLKVHVYVPYAMYLGRNRVCGELIWGTSQCFIFPYGSNTNLPTPNDGIGRPGLRIEPSTIFMTVVPLAIAHHASTSRKILGKRYRFRMLQFRSNCWKEDALYFGAVQYLPFQAGICPMVYRGWKGVCPIVYPQPGSYFGSVTSFTLQDNAFKIIIRFGKLWCMPAQAFLERTRGEGFPSIVFSALRSEWVEEG